MFNVHVGLPRVAKNLLHSFAEAKRVVPAGRSYIVSRQVYQENIRGLVSSTDRSSSLDEVSRRRAEAMIRQLVQHDVVAMSQHALLGQYEDCYLRRKVLPQGEARLARLAEVIKPFQMTVHLTITSQYDYLHAALVNDESEIEAISDNVPSWSQLVQRLRISVPEATFIVWDFERPAAIAPEFLMSLLQLSMTDVDKSELEQIVATTVDLVPSVLSTHHDSEVDALAARLDEQYELDLTVLAEMPGVSLMQPAVVTTSSF